MLDKCVADTGHCEYSLCVPCISFDNILKRQLQTLTDNNDAFMYNQYIGQSNANKNVFTKNEKDNFTFH